MNGATPANTANANAIGGVWDTTSIARNTTTAHAADAAYSWPGVTASIPACASISVVRSRSVGRDRTRGAGRRGPERQANTSPTPNNKPRKAPIYRATSSTGCASSCARS